jgi:hypothetical protein
MMPMLPKSDEASLLTLGFAIMCVILIALLVFTSNVWVKPVDAVEEGAFEWQGDVYLVEKAPPGTILRDGKVYSTEAFTQTQPSE